MKRKLSTCTLTALVFLGAALVGCNSYEVKLGPAGKLYADWPFDAAEAARRQRETAAALGLPAAETLELGGATMRLALVPAGKFRMGSPRHEQGRLPHEGPEHTVTITRVFYIARTEVTQAQWRAVMGTEPWKAKPFTKTGDDHAATYVDWESAWAFCRKLSQKTGRTFRLPTEAEWEYACRAGTATAYCFGDSEAGLDDHAWYDRNAHDVGRRYAHPVARKKPNAWGLCDMHGNVWEWCADRFDQNYYTAAASPLDPTGPTSGEMRALRGGSWYDRAWYGRAVFGPCRSAVRTGADPRFSSWFAGFRVVLVPTARRK